MYIGEPKKCQLFVWAIWQTSWCLSKMDLQLETTQNVNKKIAPPPSKKNPQAQQKFQQNIFSQFQFCQDKKKMIQTISKTFLVGSGRRSVCAMGK